MPGRDGTGPAGLGPMTGRAAGLCAGNPSPRFMNSWCGRGGRGFRNRYYASGIPGRMYAYNQVYTPQEELVFLKDQAKGMEAAFDGLNKRIAELEAKAIQTKE